ncbi:MAG: hypothetical protein E7415_06955 [Ruminococcaceae bacterium]|nr:hypothetical protein [Oscillospiraceae bacterium]
MKENKYKSRKINKRRLVFSITAIVILGILIYNIPAIYDFFMYSDYQTVSGLAGGDYRLERYDGNMIAYNNKEMLLINLKGEPEWNIQVSTTSPKVCVGDDYILMADLSGKNAYLYDEDELQTSIITKDKIFDAAMDEDGNFAIATRGHGHKGSVSIYDEKGDKQYVFESGNGHIGKLDIREDNIVISQMDVDDIGITSRVVMVDWKENKENVIETKKNEMIFDVKFMENGDVIVVSEKGLTGYEDDGEKKFNVNFNGRKLMKYNIGSDDNLVFAFNGDRNNSVIECYSKEGKLRGSRMESGEISNIDVCGEAILISSMREVKRIYPDGDSAEAIASKHDVRNIKLFGNRRYGFLTGNSCATIVKIKK